MSKTDTRNEVVSAIGTQTYTLPHLFNGWKVSYVQGGTVTREGTPLTPGSTLLWDQVLTFTPDVVGGTTHLGVFIDNAEFSGNYADLSGIPAGGGGGMDAEAVQDIVAAMLGNVGTYNDAAGTYTITLPTPHTNEEIQDVVDALIQAGTNVIKEYDDAGNVLSLSVVGGGGGSSEIVSLRTQPATLYFRGTAAEEEGFPTGTIAPYAMRFNLQVAGKMNTIRAKFNGTAEAHVMRLKVYAPASGSGYDLGALLATSTAVTVNTRNYYEFPLDSTLSYAAGDELLIVEESMDGSGYVSNIYRTSGGYTDALWVGKALVGGGGDPTPGAVLMNFVFKTGLTKGVLGPLDPADFPTSTIAAAANSTGFMVVDDAAKTASLVWKFSDGTTKSVSLT